MTEVAIENIVSSITLESPLDLPHLAETLPLASYEPDDAPMLSVTLDDPKVACLFFPTGKVILTGATSEEDISKATLQVRKLLNSNSISLEKTLDFHIDHVVASTQIDTKLDLEKVQTILPTEHIQYDLGQFPGVIYTMEYPKTVIVVFTSGKLVGLGSKITEVTQALLQVTRDLSVLEGE